MPDYYTTDPVDWDGPWGNRVHVSTGGGVDAESAEADR